MATDWYMEGPWIKNCNCDPGCPCDFNANPTHGHCQGIVAMKIEKGHFGDVDLSGLAWGGVASWPGAWQTRGKRTGFNRNSAASFISWKLSRRCARPSAGTSRSRGCRAKR